jgi:hypothetical protein
MHGEQQEETGQVKPKLILDFSKKSDKIENNN